MNDSLTFLKVAILNITFLTCGVDALLTNFTQPIYISHPQQYVRPRVTLRIARTGRDHKKGDEARCPNFAEEKLILRKKS